MGRKPNPRGKDRTRTISLDGDVAEIAQHLAGKSQLSKVLSQLLRQAYNISDEVAIMKDKLAAIVDERKGLQRLEEQMIEDIGKQEERIIHERSHILPSLYQRQGKLEEKMARLEMEHKKAIDPTTSRRKASQLQTTSNQLHEVLEEIATMEGEE
jgi:hypothetical protein